MTVSRDDWEDYENRYWDNVIDKINAVSVPTIIANDNKSKMTYSEKRYIFEEEYDDKNCCKYFKLNIAGKSEKDVVVTKEWVNRTKAMYLLISIYKDGELEQNYPDLIFVDTNIYNGYDYWVKDGVLTIKLMERINPEPDFKRIID